MAKGYGRIIEDIGFSKRQDKQGTAFTYSRHGQFTKKQAPEKMKPAMITGLSFGIAGKKEYFE